MSKKMYNKSEQKNNNNKGGNNMENNNAKKETVKEETVKKETVKEIKEETPVKDNKVETKISEEILRTKARTELLRKRFLADKDLEDMSIEDLEIKLQELENEEIMEVEAFTMPQKENRAYKDGVTNLIKMGLEFMFEIAELNDDEILAKGKEVSRTCNKFLLDNEIEYAEIENFKGELGFMGHLKESGLAKVSTIKCTVKKATSFRYEDMKDDYIISLEKKIEKLKARKEKENKKSNKKTTMSSTQIRAKQKEIQNALKVFGGLELDLDNDIDVLIIESIRKEQKTVLEVVTNLQQVKDDIESALEGESNEQ